MKRLLSALPAIIKMGVLILAFISLLVLWSDLDKSLGFKVIYVIAIIVGLYCEWTSIDFKDKQSSCYN